MLSCGQGLGQDRDNDPGQMSGCREDMPLAGATRRVRVEMCTSSGQAVRMLKSELEPDKSFFLTINSRHSD